LPIFVAATLALLLGETSRADQSDPRLNGLFTQLHEATNPAVAHSAESEIWSIWHETPDEKSMAIMRNARLALDGKDFSSAITLLDKLVDYSPNFAEAWNQRAIVLYLAEDYTGSLRDIEQTLALEPRHFGALSGRGQVYLRLDEPELALQAFESALDRNPWMANIRGQMEMIKAYLNSRQKPI
jgi:tetratricopeptide (TPR) repeat protein